ncbi:IclR family transcriptional regulator [Pseudarthrobacter oxydans]|uniref:IclR family transcriptional regulator n=1 Tax=Pseudarthrobacter oxydans TaxID=1671 RepID=UPI00342CCE9E
MSEVVARGSAAPPPAILRGAEILRIVAEKNGMPVKATAMAKALGIPRSSAVNICAALDEVGFLRMSEAGYTLGPKLGELGQAFFSTFAPVRNFAEYCQSVDPMPMTVQLGTLDAFDVVYLARHDGKDLISIASRVGGRLPANCTALGKAMLASLDAAQLDLLLDTQPAQLASLTPDSISDIYALRAALVTTAENGYALDDEETTPGIVCVAVPLSPRQDIQHAYAVSASILRVNATPERIESAVRLLTNLTQAVSGGSSNTD